MNLNQSPCSPLDHPRWVCLFIRFGEMAQQLMLCSEWVPSEWESDKNITIIHITPVHQITSGEDKRWNKSIIKMLLTSNHRLWPKYESIIVLPSVKKTMLSLTSKSKHIFYKAWFVLAYNAAWSVQMSLLIQTRTLDHGGSVIMDRIRHFSQFEVKKLKSQKWISFLQTHRFCLLQMLTDGLEWCGLLWCFNQLFGLSFWRHPFTAEHPLLIDVMKCYISTNMTNKLIYILNGLRVSTCYAFSCFFGEIFL